MSNKITKARLHFWDRCFLKQDLSLFRESNQSPIRRLSVTVIIAGDRPFLIRDENNEEKYFQGIILGPDTDGTGIEATGSDITTIDAFITTSAYRDLLVTLKGEKNRLLTSPELEKTQQLCRESFCQELNHEKNVALFESVIYALCERNSASKPDSRILEVCELVEHYPADEITVAFLASKINLSESRLRTLFRQEMHCTLSLYIRNVSAWKTIPLLAQGSNFTEVAHEVGFHDLAHYSRAVSEITGGPPSNIHSSEISVTFGFNNR